MNEDKNYEKAKPLSLLDISNENKNDERISAIAKEFRKGFDSLVDYRRSVTIFGSTQPQPGDADYEAAVELAGRIVKELHYSVITGGGPGIMEAANKGAYEAGGNSLGLTIELPTAQTTNKYLTNTVGFHYFFSRKVCLAFCAEAYVFFPGGFGTLDEFTEILMLVQTHKITEVPIILVGVEYWKPLVEFFKNTLLKEGKIDAADLDLFILTDDQDQIIEAIKNAPIR